MKICKLASGLAGLTVALAVAEEARAATTAYDLLDQFNAIVFGDFVERADVEERAVVGNSLTRPAGELLHQALLGAGTRRPRWRR